MDVVDCIFKVLGVGYVLWMLSFLFLQPQETAQEVKSVRPWWLDYKHPEFDRDIAAPSASVLERRN